VNKELILVIDDDADICEIVRVNLEGFGYAVITGNDGEHGLELARKSQPDLIILDVLMPNMDGWQVLREIEKDHQLAGIPVVMLTCRSEEQDVLRGLSHGAIEYVTKPFYPENLVASVKILLDVFDPAMRQERRQQLIARRKTAILSNGNVARPPAT